jgi:DNA-binding SARP family transcriptional activator/tetratricopeptide (TPR) repeat protein
MDIQVLGPLEANVDGRPVPLGGAKPRALLAMLALNAGSAVSVERLIDGLWGEQPPATATKLVQVYVSQLRRALAAGGDGAAIVTRGRGYALRVDPDAVDAGRFERLVAQGAPREALALWRGAPLDDVADEPFAAAEIRRLEELRLAALELAIERDLDAGRHRDVVGELDSLVAAEPLREQLHAQRMLALYRSGRQADALEAYRQARKGLVDAIGVEPGPELRRLHEAILVQDPALEAPAAEAVKLPPGLDAGTPLAGREAPRRLGAVGSRSAAETPGSAFVGREPELAELVAGLDDAFAGRGRLFLLVGEPGIGKSRLAEELIAHARARGARVLVGRCWEAGGAPAYWPWVQSLRAYVRDSETAALHVQLGAGAADLAQILPELRGHFSDLTEPLSLEPEQARFRLFDATAEFLRNASESRPIVLVLDDLHAADVPSLLLLRFLARELGSARMLVLGVYRDVDPIPGQSLTEMLAEVAREPVTRRLSLGGLSERELAEYVELTASEIASPELVAALREETEGNPLFVGEIVRLLSVEGVRSESAADVRLAIPDSVRDVIARRLTHLSEECNRVLVLASVIGREIAIDALALVARVSEDELLDVLDEAMAARVVSDVPGVPGRLRFAHVLIRDTLYEGLTSARRVRLHRQAVEALEALYRDEPGPHLAELAHHSIAGRDFDRGLRYARRAGDRGLALLAYEESARLYAAALDVLARADPSHEGARCELLVSLGEAEARAGNTPAAKTAFLEAAGLAQRLGLSRELARAAAGYGGRIVWGRAGEDDRLVPLLERGLAALAEDDVELRARLLARLAGALRDEHSRDRRDTLSREAVEVARRTQNPAALGYALDGRAAAIVAPDTVAECLALGSELCELAERSTDPERILAGHFHRIIAQLQVGDIRGAEHDLAAASRIAHELKQPAHLWQACGVQAMLALAAGRLTEADELVAQALALGERAQRGAAIPVHCLQRYTLCDFRGGLEEVEPAICDLVAEHPARPVFRCVLVHLHARLGRLPEAKRALGDLARDSFSALPFDQEWGYGMSLLAETSGLLGDTDSAAILYRLLLPWAALNVVDQAEGIRGSLARYLGLLATTTRRSEEAEQHFEDALAMNAQMGARPWLAHTQNDYARMLLARGGPGDRGRAQQLVNAALATYRELSMESYAASASALAQEVGASA